MNEPKIVSLIFPPVGFVISGRVRVPRQLKYFRDHIKRHATDKLDQGEYHTLFRSFIKQLLPVLAD